MHSSKLFAEMLFYYFCNGECSLYLVNLELMCSFYVLYGKTSNSGVINIKFLTDLNI